MSKKRGVVKAMMQLIPKPKAPEKEALWDDNWTADDWENYLYSCYPSDEEVLSDVRKALGVE